MLTSPGLCLHLLCVCMQVFDKATGAYVRHIGTRGEGNGQLQYPNSVAVDGPYVYVTEKGNHRVQARGRARTTMLTRRRWP
jgi:DNA-binding beta-propeller fold protein YncE